MNTLPKIADLYQDIEQVAKLDQLNALLNQQPMGFYSAEGGSTCQSIKLNGSCNVFLNHTELK